MAKQTKMGQGGGGELKLLYFQKRGVGKVTNFFVAMSSSSINTHLQNSIMWFIFQPAEGNIHTVIYKT